MQGLPWTWKAQSPRNVDRLRIDKLTIYCGDKMLRPYGITNEWIDITTHYVFKTPVHHNGNPASRFCDVGALMVVLSVREQVRPSPEGVTISVVLMCPQVFDVQPLTGRKRIFTVRQALQLQNQIWLGMPMTYMADVIFISPVLFHEMFHAAMAHAPSK
jgi:hypothetical protein